MIRRKRADTFIYRLWCDKCLEQGIQSQMRSTTILSSDPPHYVHACENAECDHKETIIGRAYPSIDYVEIEEEVGTPPTPPAPNLKPVA